MFGFIKSLALLLIVALAMRQFDGSYHSALAMVFAVAVVPLLLAHSLIRWAAQ